MYCVSLKTHELENVDRKYHDGEIESRTRMRRLGYENIFRRHEEASGFCTKSVFSDDEPSFALRYYRDSPRLQELHTEIEQHAQREREQKRTELRVLNKSGNN